VPEELADETEFNSSNFKVSRAGFLMVLLILSALYSEEF
jgi:hypothetical protein